MTRRDLTPPPSPSHVTASLIRTTTVQPPPPGTPPPPRYAILMPAPPQAPLIDCGSLGPPPVGAYHRASYPRGSLERQPRNREKLLCSRKVSRDSIAYGNPRDTAPTPRSPPPAEIWRLIAESPTGYHYRVLIAWGHPHRVHLPGHHSLDVPWRDSLGVAKFSLLCNSVT